MNCGGAASESRGSCFTGEGHGFRVNFVLARLFAVESDDGK